MPAAPAKGKKAKNANLLIVLGIGGAILFFVLRKKSSSDTTATVPYQPIFGSGSGAGGSAAGGVTDPTAAVNQFSPGGSLAAPGTDGAGVGGTTGTTATPANTSTFASIFSTAVGPVLSDPISTLAGAPPIVHPPGPTGLGLGIVYGPPSGGSGTRFIGPPVRQPPDDPWGGGPPTPYPILPPPSSFVGNPIADAPGVVAESTFGGIVAPPKVIGPSYVSSTGGPTV